MIFDLVVGGELFEDIVAREHYSESSASACIYLILDALAYCHRNGVIHRDLKPENLLLASRSRDAPVKIADFGLAVQTSDNQPRRHGLAGTYVYMAPEVIREMPYNNAVDVWSCGVILYLLLAGYPPFMDRDDDRLQRKILTTRHTYPPNEWSLITRAAKDLIDQMLQRDASRRISAAAALQHPWLRERVRVASNIHLREAVDHLKQFNARRKFKAAVVTTMLANRQLKGTPPSPVASDNIPSPDRAFGARQPGFSRSSNDISVSDKPRDRWLPTSTSGERGNSDLTRIVRVDRQSSIEIVREPSEYSVDNVGYTTDRVVYPLRPAYEYDHYNGPDSDWTRNPTVKYYIEYTEPTYRYVQPARSMKVVYAVAPRRNRVFYW
ncbi:Calcium/calmodulin-dependent protein kinase type II alpha chain [Clonorchis sinensis]|uniref:Calcium/calmodulin-dependent protein kinase type II alpha chain n=1 Tax=Clonorchis sinensis TaxID=79923 RepID=A0A8T1M1I9_CLOSI|nr:Calcium/calmodulin-dependent protein kinase type II alpha chain [Clonorchis sinensis]